MNIVENSKRKFSEISSKDTAIEIEDSGANNFPRDSLLKPQMGNPLSSGEAIKTFCRIRPIEGKNELFKIKEDDDKILLINMENLKMLNINLSANNITSYTFSKTFGETSTQVEVFNFTCKSLVEDLIKKRKSGLIFTYGMTNAGKTFTVIGSPSNPGILPLSLQYLYSCMQESSNDFDLRRFSVMCNFVEIYNEEVYDLLSNDPTGKNKLFKKKLTVKENQRNIFYLSDVSCVKLSNLEEFTNALNKGISKKTHAATNLNQNSSRSHTIFKLILTPEIEEDSTEEISLSIVDLAGSERATRTETQGKEFQEACKINQSLSTLGKCMETLKFNSIYSHKRLVPFRESKLTKLFQEYFQGDQNIIIITNINPRREDFEESIRALNYSCIAKEIKPIKSKIIVNPIIVNHKKKQVKLLEQKTPDGEKEKEKMKDEMINLGMNQSINLENQNLNNNFFNYVNFPNDISFLQAEVQKLREELITLKSGISSDNSNNCIRDQLMTTSNNNPLSLANTENSLAMLGIMPYCTFNPLLLTAGGYHQPPDLDAISSNAHTVNLVFINSKFNDFYMGPKKRQRKKKIKQDSMDTDTSKKEDEDAGETKDATPCTNPTKTELFTLEDISLPQPDIEEQKITTDSSIEQENCEEKTEVTEEVPVEKKKRKKRIKTQEEIEEQKRKRRLRAKERKEQEKRLKEAMNESATHLIELKEEVVQEVPQENEEQSDADGEVKKNKEKEIGDNIHANDFDLNAIKK